MRKIITGFVAMLVGISSLCIGSTLGIIAGLGQTTSTGTCSAIAAAFNMQVGTAMIFLYSFFLLLQLIFMGREFKVRRLLQVIPVWLNGIILNYFRYSFPPFQLLAPESYPEKMLVFLAGMVLISLGFTLVKCSDFINYPPEAFCVLISDKFNIRFGTCKIGLDILYVLSSLIICLIFSVKPDMVREGTLIFALCNGLLINFFQPYIEKLCRKIKAE